MSRIVEDGYEPATVGDAWSEYLAAHPEIRGDHQTAAWHAFRAGYRRGIAQGALLASSTIVHPAGIEATR